MRESVAHMTPADLEWYVTEGIAATGASDQRVERIELHVAACDHCAARLADEAQLELTLADVAARPPRRSSRYSSVLFGAVLAAAVFALFVLGSASARDADPPASQPATTVATPVDAGVRVALDSSLHADPSGD